MAIRVVVGKAGEQVVAQCDEGTSCIPQCTPDSFPSLSDISTNIVKPAFLILSSAGKSHVEGIIVGSVSNYAISHVKSCPVIVARMTTEMERGRGIKQSKAGQLRGRSPMWF